MGAKDPIERRGIDQNLWVWESPDYSRDYMVVADVARGDGKDFSTAHIVEIETNTQVAEYKGQMPPKDFGFFLVGLATEYNNALLVVENSNVGWATLDAILEREYSNLYYSTRSEKLTAESYLKAYESSSDLVPGFTTSLKTRPLLLTKFREFVGEHSIDIRSRRLLEEMKVFIWKNGRAEAQSGYNDDLIMAMAIGMYLRDTSLRFQQKNMDMAKASLSSMQRQTQNFASGGYSNKVQNPYSMDIGKNKENLNWLL